MYKEGKVPMRTKEQLEAAIRVSSEKDTNPDQAWRLLGNAAKEIRSPEQQLSPEERENLLANCEQAKQQAVENFRQKCPI